MGAMLSFMVRDMYEATMSRDFYFEHFWSFKEITLFWWKKMLLTGKKSLLCIDTVDETYLKFSRHYNENIQKVTSGSY